MAAHAEASFASLVPEVRRRWGTVRVFATVPLFCAAVLFLWTSGYPRWRVGVTATVFLAFTVLLPRVTRALTSVESPSGLGRAVWPEAANAVLIFALLGVTGGLRSPFLIGLPAAFVTLYGVTGWSPIVWTITALNVVGLLALTFAPAAALGPTIPSPVFDFLAVATVVGTVVTNFSTITVQQRARAASEAALARARELVFTQLCQRTRDMEQVGASLSHELRNPLQAIKVLVQLSAREVQGQRARERLNVAEAEIERMQALINDYLSFSRPFEKLKPQPVDMASLCDEVFSVLRERATACDIALTRDGNARVQVDPRRLREALHNLVSNAIDASPRGSSVRVEITAVAGSARISVRDSGKGMSAETLQRIGTPFFTTREDGTGLGVALARAVFLQHGGSLEYESQPGAGTTAVALLPLLAAGSGVDAARAGG